MRNMSLYNHIISGKRGGPMHHKCQPRGGSRNSMRDLLEELEDEEECNSTAETQLMNPGENLQTSHSDSGPEAL